MAAKYTATMQGANVVVTKFGDKDEVVKTLDRGHTAALLGKGWQTSRLFQKWSKT